MKVERARIDDIDALAGLRLSYLREDRGSLDERDAEVIRNHLPGYYASHMDRDLFIYLIREGREIVSCAFLLIVEKPMSPAFINGKTGTVMNVYTRPAARRKGYAASVIKALLDDAGSMELSVIELKTTEEGYPLYLSAGFTDDCSGYRRMKWKPSYSQHINPMDDRENTEP